MCIKFVTRISEFYYKGGVLLFEGLGLNLVCLLFLVWPTTKQPTESHQDPECN